MPEAFGSPLIAALCNAASSNLPTTGVRVVETHISWVLLTGTHAYKIKKPVNLGFLDFSTLEKRRFFCEEELRLNRRLAPNLYLEVLPITGTLNHPRLGGPGPALEYAVKMWQFDEAGLGDRMASDQRLEDEHIDRLAETLAAFHGQAARSTGADDHGLPRVIQDAAEYNFIHIRPLLETAEELNQLDQLRAWTQQQYKRLQERLRERKNGGFVRECHGDLHLGNLVLIGERLIPFDCIEFSENLRWIDVISEMAFIVMDLEVKGAANLAFRLLNRYLQITGDYTGLDLLDYYLVYRALVRAKIACLTRAQNGKPEKRDALAGQCRAYMAHAASASEHPSHPCLLIMHGYSGSGKSYLAARIAERLPAIHLRSDIERKRLTGLRATTATRDGLGAGIYTEEMTRITYSHLLNTAQHLLADGFSVIVDATFLTCMHRQAQRALAEKIGVPFLIVDVKAPESILCARIGNRLATGTDPSEADIRVLQHQLDHDEPLDATEYAFALTVDTDSEPKIEKIMEEIASRCDA